MSARRQIVVVGSGVAGLIAALELSGRHDVTLVTKSELMESNTRYAQGGVAAAMFTDDSVAEHVADTIRAGAGLCNREAVEALCAEGPQRIRQLIQLGVAFDQRNGELARGLEAAHSHARVLHAGGDATGLSIELALVAAVRNADVTVLEHTFASELVLQEERVVGLKVIGPSEVPTLLRAEAVVLASGGAGQLYQHTTNPTGATGDGAAVAFRAGAQLADVEFYQFHPTALATGDTFLISEAVRGEGAVLLDAEGRRFMQALHKDAELAPRDIVARGIAMQMATQDGLPVMLDATRLGGTFLRERFPSIDAACRSRGFEWTKEPIPVTPAAHYWMGGVKTDLWGRTSIKGLFAIGEAACTGVHGANRLASNSLLESLVFAWRCATFLLSNENLASADIFSESVIDRSEAEFATRSGRSVPVDRKTLQKLMWDAVGIERKGDDLQAALNMMASWHVDGDSIDALETSNLLTLARVVTESALQRQESRGAHFRSDYPESSDFWRRSLSVSVPLTELCR